MLRRRLGILLGALLLAGTTSVGLASPAAAEYIRHLDVAITVNADTSIRIVETITYDFESEYRHGIFRDIPVVDETLTGLRRDDGRVEREEIRLARDGIDDHDDIADV